MWGGVSLGIEQVVGGAVSPGIGCLKKEEKTFFYLLFSSSFRSLSSVLQFLFSSRVLVLREVDSRKYVGG